MMAVVGIPKVAGWSSRVPLRLLAVLALGLASLWLVSSSDRAAASTPAPQNQRGGALAPHNSAIIDNGLDVDGDGDTDDPGDMPAIVQMGINDEGHLNVAGGTPSSQSETSPVGLRYVPTNGESTAPGCLCEGWGVADASTGTTGYANVSVDGVFNLELESFTATGVGTTEVTGSAPAGSPYREATAVVLVREVIPVPLDICTLVAGGGGGEGLAALADVPEGSICNEDGTINPDALAELLCNQFGECGPQDPADVCTDLGLCDTEGDVDLAKVTDDLCSTWGICASYEPPTPYATDDDGLAALCSTWGLCSPDDAAALADFYCFFLGACAPFELLDLLCDLGLCDEGGALDPALVEAFICEGAPFLCQETFELGEPVLRVTHRYVPSEKTRNLYVVTVTVENLSDQPVGDLRYRRVMDWDIPPTTFSELSTIQGCCGNANGDPDDDPAGAADNLIRTDTNGFDTANPLATLGSFQSGNVVDAGPADHGALFDFAFGMIGAGESKSFKTYYGAAGSEAEALTALAAVGAEAYSFGQPAGAGETGTPNTFIFAFGEVGGEVLVKQSDLEAVSKSAVGLPELVNAGEDTPFTIREVVRNNGPYNVEGPVAAIVRDTVTPPADCALTFHASESFFDIFAEIGNDFRPSFFDVFFEDVRQNTGQPEPGSMFAAAAGIPVTLELFVMLPVGEEVTIDEPWSIECSDPSNHEVTLQKSIGPDEVGVSDPKAENNSVGGTAGFAVLAAADFEVATLEIIGATDILGSPIDLAGAEAADVHMIELPPEVLALLPDGIGPLGAAVELAVRDEVSNNGPWDAEGPVTGAVWLTLNTPPDCIPAFFGMEGDPFSDLEVMSGDTVVEPVAEGIWSGPPGGPLSIHFKVALEAGESASFDEFWGLLCLDPSNHQFSFEKTVMEMDEDEHVTDPFSENDTMALEFDFNVVAESDIEAVSKEVTSSTAELETGQVGDVEVVERVRNNGPWDPDGEVTAAVWETLGAPIGCVPVFNVTAGLLGLIVPGSLEVKSGAATLAKDPPAGTVIAGGKGSDLSIHFKLALALEEEASLTESWSVACDEPGDHVFSFDKQVMLMDDEHVIDPVSENDTASAEFTVHVVDDGGANEPRIIDGDIVLVSMKSRYSASPDAAHPDLSTGGVLTVTATWRNDSADSFFDVFFEVLMLDGMACPCVLLNADGGPGGVGAELSVPDSDLPGGNELWEPGEQLGKRVFRIGVTAKAPLTFKVNVWGTEPD
jgi:hypothetical protein